MRIEPAGLIERIDVDLAHADPDRLFERGGRLAVAVHDDLAGLDAGRERHAELELRWTRPSVAPLACSRRTTRQRVVRLDE